MRIPFIAGNWKMFKTVAEAVVFVKELKLAVKDLDRVEIALAPPFTALHAVAEAARNTNIGVAAQDVYWEREGAFTGEISPAMIKEAGAEYAIVGHSERRRLFGESDTIVNRKTMATIAAGLTPIVCIGETLEERERDETLAVLDRQIKDGLGEMSAAQVAEIVIAYEPVWAIGTGRVATPEQAQDAIAFVRALVADRDREEAQRTRILYGGSVKPDNAAELISQQDVDGALVGGASLDPDDFAAIVAAAA